MAVCFEEMTVGEFEAFRRVSLKNYAKQNIKSGTWTEKEAFEKSEKVFRMDETAAIKFFGTSGMTLEKTLAGCGCMLTRTIRKKRRLFIHLACMKLFAEKGWLNWRFRR